MIIRCLIALIPPIFAQIPPQPVVTTSSACLNDCLQQGSLVFAAANLRNFQKIILNIEQFCDTQEQLTKCAQSCTDEERQNLAQRTALSAHICKDKLEEFRLVKVCVEGQETDYVNQCANDCGHPTSATIQLDSSPAAAVNPFAFFDSITPVCRTIECIMKCSITGSNKKCAGSGDLFRDIGFKQVVEASERLHNDIFNSSSSVAQQLAKIYLEALPEECAYIIDPVKYDTMFSEHEGNAGSLVTVSALDVEGNIAKQSSAMGEGEAKATTTGTFSANNDDVITRIFDVQIETKSTESPVTATVHTVSTVKESEQVTATTAAVAGAANEPDIPLGLPASEDVASSTEGSDSGPALPETPVQIQIQPVPPHIAVEHIPEQEQSATTGATSATEGESANKEDVATAAGHIEEEGHDHEEPEEEEEAEHGSTVSSASDEAGTIAVIQKLNESEDTAEAAENIDLKHLSTPATSLETERTIVVVNEDNEHEIDTNTVVHQEHNAPEQQKELKKSGARERITVLLSLILPLLPLCFFNL